MKLFWKFFLVTVVCFVVATLFFSSAIYVRQAAEAKHLVTDEIAVASRFIAGELEVRGARSEWPFESLISLSEREDILFWWVVRQDGVIHLANDVEFMDTDARPFYPDLTETHGEVTRLYPDRNYGVFIKSFPINDQTWHFVIGFSLAGVAAMERDLIMWMAIYFCGALVILGLVTWLMVRRLTRPIGVLLFGVERIGKGELSHRVKVESSDEIGSLAAAFNDMAAKLKDVYDNLEAKVEARTKELEAHRLEFISVASHQLKTPITSLKWGAETLEERTSAMDVGTRELVADMHKAASGMADLVNALLNVSRLELGTYAVIQEPVSLEEELKGVLKLLSAQISDKRLKVQMRVGERLPKVYEADRQLVIIIIQNLVSNAVKYSHDGGEVRVSLDLTEQGVIIKVSDDGIGIPLDQQDKLFNKMFRADNARNVEGTGLGLHVVKRVVESVNGTIGFISVENKGSVFTVVLPSDGMPARAGTRRLT